MNTKDLKSEYGKEYYQRRIITRLEAKKEMMEIIKADPYIKLIEETFPPAKTWFFSSNIYFEFPWSNALIEEMKIFMKKENFDFDYEFISMPSYEGGVASKTIYYRVPDMELRIQFEFSSGIDKSTCVLNKIGEEERIVKRPVYEVVCSEAAAKEFTMEETNATG